MVPFVVVASGSPPLNVKLPNERLLVPAAMGVKLILNSVPAPLSVAPDHVIVSWPGSSDLEIKV